MSLITHYNIIGAVRLKRERWLTALRDYSEAILTPLAFLSEIWRPVRLPCSLFLSQLPGVGMCAAASTPCVLSYMQYLHRASVLGYGLTACFSLYSTLFHLHSASHPSCVRLIFASLSFNNRFVSVSCALRFTCFTRRYCIALLAYIVT